MPDRAGNNYGLVKLDHASDEPERVARQVLAPAATMDS